jgi:hypothetical protein
MHRPSEPSWVDRLLIHTVYIYKVKLAQGRWPPSPPQRLPVPNANVRVVYLVTLWEKKSSMDCRALELRPPRYNKFDLPPKKRHIGIEYITDPSLPQKGDCIVVYFYSRWNTGWVLEAYVDDNGNHLYSVNYKSGYYTRDASLEAITWSFHSSSPKHVKKDRPKPIIRTGDRFTTGRVRKPTDVYSAESATEHNKKQKKDRKSAISCDLFDGSADAKKKEMPISVCVDYDSEYEVVEAYEAVAESDYDDDDGTDYVECEVMGM